MKILGVICGAFLLSAAPSFGADPYPATTVRVIAPSGPSGTTDLVARIISQQLSEQLGKPFVVENRAGAGGTIALAMVAKSAPDGHTLVVMNTSDAMAPNFYNELSFDVVKDFTPISQIIRAPQVFVVDPALNVRTLAEFIALARASPSKFGYSSAGVGTSSSLIVEFFKKAAGIDLIHVPYKSSGEAMGAVLGSQAALTAAGIATVLPHVNSGKLRALAITTDGARSPLMPDVPSMAESGLPGVSLYAWHGLVGPAGMPKETVERLRSEVVKAISSASVKGRFSAVGAEVVGSTPDEFSALIRNEVVRWAEVVRAVGVAREK